MHRILTAVLTITAAALLGVVMLRPNHAAAGPASPAAQTDELSLLCDTPEQGFALAITLSRKSVTTIQPNREILHELRPQYASDAGDLIAASHVVAIYFDTIAAANDYWRR
jgi:hypothetical protein